MKISHRENSVSLRGCISGGVEGEHMTCLGVKIKAYLISYKSTVYPVSTQTQWSDFFKMNSLSVYSFALNINRVSKTYQLDPMFAEYEYTTQNADKQNGQQIAFI